MAKRRKTAERKAKAAQAGAADAHIHCVACGRHIESEEISTEPATARYLRCLHGRRFAACMGCVDFAQRLLAEHDRTGREVESAPLWH